MRNTFKNLTYLGFLTTVGGTTSQVYADTIPTLEERESNLVLDKTSPNSAITLSKNEIPRVTEEVVKERLRAIEDKIALPYSPGVMRVIEEYTVRSRRSTEELLIRSSFYFPIFEETLAKYNLPDEIKYLAVIESNLKPEVKSYVSAAGLWQFMPSTGLSFGLKQNAYVDERVDPFKSTEAACEYFQYLYERLGDWHLVFAAYNCGEGAVLNAMKASGSRDFQAIYPYLPAQTRSYLPKFVGMIYVMKYAEEHNIQVENTWQAVPSKAITLQGQTSLQDLAKKYNTTLEIIKRLNPHLKQGFIPSSMASDYTLRVPDFRKTKKRKGTRRLAKAILAGKQDSVVNAGKNQHLQLLHPVKAGESLTSIAKLYDVKVADIKFWNKEVKKQVKTNQQLSIWVRQRKVRQDVNKAHTTG